MHGTRNFRYSRFPRAKEGHSISTIMQALRCTSASKPHVRRISGAYICLRTWRSSKGVTTLSISSKSGSLKLTLNPWIYPSRPWSGKRRMSVATTWSVLARAWESSQSRESFSWLWPDWTSFLSTPSTRSGLNPAQRCRFCTETTCWKAGWGGSRKTRSSIRCAPGPESHNSMGVIPHQCQNSWFVSSLCRV